MGAGTPLSPTMVLVYWNYNYNRVLKSRHKQVNIHEGNYVIDMA